jgi:hypothetical protein
MTHDWRLAVLFRYRYVVYCRVSVNFDGDEVACGLSLVSSGSNQWKIQSNVEKASAFQEN